jgi:hypothetical protein
MNGLVPGFDKRTEVIAFDRVVVGINASTHDVVEGVGEMPVTDFLVGGAL